MCGKEFENYFDETQFCSRFCYREYKAEHSIYSDAICPICHKIFKPTRKGQKYCSAECRASSTRKRVICICDYCGKPFQRKPSECKSSSRNFCSRECYKNGCAWSDSDTQILRDNYGKMAYSEMVNLFSVEKTSKAISSRAISIGIVASRDWSEEEIAILTENYGRIPIHELTKMLPNRTVPSIRGQARQHKLLSYFYTHHNYSKDEDAYIRANYLTETNVKIAQTLHRSENGIGQHLLCLGLHRPTEIDNYKRLYNYLRARLTTWRDRYRESKGFTCALTGSHSGIVVHHIRGFNLILAEAMDNLDFPIYTDIKNYSQGQLDSIYNEYMTLQEYYGQYICVCENIHDQFHSLYGCGNNTKEQWDEFVRKYYPNKINETV